MSNEREQDMDVLHTLSRLTGVEYSDEQRDILLHRGGMCILACAGSGKALVHGTGVLTPKGYTPIENIKPGMEVYDMHGCRQKVLGVYPQGPKAVYRVNFSDGTSAKCCGDHLWIIKDKRNLFSGGCEVQNTYTLYEEWYNGESKREAVVPLTLPIQFDGQDTSVSPYLMGLILSIGSRAGSNIYLTLPMNEILLKVKEELEKLGAVREQVEKNEVTFRIKASSVLPSETGAGIPDIYKLNSVEARAEMLGSFIDVWGERKECGYSIIVKKPELTPDIIFLIQTLGLYVKKQVNGSQTEIYVSGIDTYQEVHGAGSLLDIEAYDEIESIKKLNIEKEMTCLMVDGETKSFVIDNCKVTHNTTIITHLLAKRILTHEIQNVDTLLCTTYSKGGADEMEQRLSSLFKQVGIRKSVSVKTMHALYLNVLRYFGYPSTVIDSRDRRKYLLEACREREIRLDDEDFDTLDSLLSYQVNYLLSDAQLVQSYAYTLTDVSLEEYSAIRKGYANRKIQHKVIDFDDMQLYMYLLVCQQNRQDVLDYCRANWTDIYVDEAQDMSRIQYVILKKLISDPSKFVVVGDDDQAIYEWRGADPSIILNVCGDYDISRFVLSTNYRCAGNIVEKAAVGIKHNIKRSDKEMKPFVEGGNIQICDCGSTNLYTMSKYAYKHIKKLVMEDDVRPSEIAVLSRNNSHLSIISNMLFKDGIHCEATNEMKMTKSATYRAIKNVLKLAEDGYNAEVTKSVLSDLVQYMKKADAVRIAQVQESSSARLSDLLGFICQRFWKFDDVVFDKTPKIPALALGKIDYTLSGFTEEKQINIHLIYKLLTNPDKAQCVIGLLALFLTATEFKYRGNPDKKRAVEGLVDYISDLVKTMGFEETKQFLKVTEQYEEGRMAVPGPKVVMSTMHGAKGKEWEHVVLFADDNVTFPSFVGLASQLQRGVATSDIYRSIDENRRLHYVAMTRAKKELAVFTDKQNTGVYLLEAMGIFNYGLDNNSHIVSMATTGEMYSDLIKGASEQLFSEDSPYNYKLDVSDMHANIEIDFMFRGKETQNTISLDDIQTGTPQGF